MRTAWLISAFFVASLAVGLSVVYGRGIAGEIAPAMGSLDAPELLSKPFVLLRGRVEDAIKSVFSYRSIAVAGNYRLSREAILAEAGLDEGDWIWNYLPGRAAVELRRHSWIDRAEVSAGIFPTSLKIRIIEAEPWLVAEYGGRSWLISSSGRLLCPLADITDPEMIVDLSELPRLEGLDAQPGLASYLASANARLTYALTQIRFLEMAQTVPFDVDLYHLLPAGDLEIGFYDHGGRYTRVLMAVRSYEQAMDTRRKLAVVLADLEERAEPVEQLDLRFADQVVVDPAAPVQAPKRR